MGEELTVTKPESAGKPFDISKREVWEAYQKVIPEAAGPVIPEGAGPVNPPVRVVIFLFAVLRLLLGSVG